MSSKLAPFSAATDDEKVATQAKLGQLIIDCGDILTDLLKEIKSTRAVRPNLADLTQTAQVWWSLTF